MGQLQQQKVVILPGDDGCAIARWLVYVDSGRLSLGEAGTFDSYILARCQRATELVWIGVAVDFSDCSLRSIARNMDL